MEYLAEIAAAHVDFLPKTEISKYMTAFGEFYLECLEYRTYSTEKEVCITLFFVQCF